MERICPQDCDRYEIVVKRVGRSDPLETNVLGEKETQKILRLIGLLNLQNLRSALRELNEGCPRKRITSAA